MRTWATSLGIFMAVLLGGYAACSEMFPSATWRYKITVSVDTPEGDKTGSAVREVYAWREPKVFPEQPAGHASSKGEAVVIDLGDRGVLFALIGSDDYMVVFDAFPFSGGGTTREGIEYYSHLRKAKAALTPKQYPMLVTFRDLSDPKSVERVLETDWCRERNSDGTCVKEEFFIKADRFEELFGKGVKLKEITIEMTDEPVTWGIEKWLPWLEALNGGYLHGGSTSRAAPLGLYGGNFKAGR